MIKEVSPRDEGVYKCRAENSEGYATTTAFLVVRGKSWHCPQRDVAL